MTAEPMCNRAWSADSCSEIDRQIPWGNFSDPDIETGLNSYREADLVVLRPNDVNNLSNPQLTDFAHQCGRLLMGVYGTGSDGNPRYPLEAKDNAALIDGIREEKILMFALMDRTDKLRSMAAIVLQDNPFDRGVKFAELGRAAESPQNGVSSRALLKERVRWAIDHELPVDFLFSTTRSATAWASDLPSGKGIQSVWWGSRRFPESHIPFVTTEAGWDHKLERPEPFTNFTIPIAPGRWAEKINKTQIYVDSMASAAVIGSFVREGTRGIAQPIIEIAPDNNFDEIRATSLSPLDPLANGLYVITQENPQNSSEKTLPQIDSELSSAISQKIVVEADISSTPASSAIMRRLAEQGWTTVGWRPSQIKYGAICPVMARLNPNEINTVVTPEHHKPYYDKGGMPETRTHLDSMYAKMLQIATRGKE